MDKNIQVFYNKGKQVDYIASQILEYSLPLILKSKIKVKSYPIKYLSQIADYVSNQCDIYLIDIPLSLNQPLTLYNNRIFSINPYWANPNTEMRQVGNLTIKMFGYQFGKYNEIIRPNIIAMLSQIIKRNIVVENLNPRGTNYYNLIDNLDTLEYGINPITPATKYIYDFINTRQIVTCKIKNNYLVVVGNNINYHHLPSYYILEYQGFKFLIAREEESYQKSRLLLRNNQVDAIVTINLKVQGNSVLKYLIINDNCIAATQSLIQGLKFELGQPISKTGYATSGLNLSAILYSLLQSKE